MSGYSRDEAAVSPFAARQREYGDDIASVVSILFVTALGVVACTKTSEVNAEATAACTDRTNNISCQSCCETENSGLIDNVCTCRGKVLPPK